MFKVDISGLRKNFLNIFDDPAVCVREIIQNSWEAILLRQKDDEQFIPKISIELVDNKLIFSDNGCGMTPQKMEEVLPFLFNSSWSDSDDWEGIGKFGMGLKTSLLLSNKLTVISRHMESNESWKWEVNVEIPDSYVFKKIKDECSVGTKIILELEDIDCIEDTINAINVLGSKVKIEEKIRYYADFLPCPILLDNVQINLGGMCGLDNVDYEPIEWYMENYEEDSFPLETMLFDESFAKGVLFATPNNQKKSKLILYRMGLRIGEIDSSDVFSYFGHHIVGFIECPKFELYVDRHRVKPGEKFDTFKDKMDNTLDNIYISLANNKPQKFNEIIKMHPIDMKISLYQRDAFRKAVWQEIRLPLYNGRWINMKKFVESSIEKNDKKYLFFSSGGNGQNILLPIFDNINIPVIKAETIVNRDKNIDVLLIKEIASDIDGEARRVDQSLEIVFTHIDTVQSKAIIKKTKPLLEEHEDVNVFENSAVNLPVLCRVSDETVEEEVISEEMREKKNQFLELLSMLGDDDDKIKGMLSSEKQNTIFINMSHPIINMIMDIPDEKYFRASMKLLILDSYMQMGVILNDSQSLSHHDSLATLIHKSLQ